MKIKVAVFQHESGGLTVELIPTGQTGTVLDKTPEFSRISENLEVEFEVTGEPKRPAFLQFYGEAAA